MGDYSVPLEIRQLKPKGTMVKHIKNGYYVYEFKSWKENVINPDGTKKRITHTKTGKCIGHITLKEGFVPNNNKLHDDKIVVKNYGDYAFSIKHSEKTFNELARIFNIKDAQKIYCVAIIFFVNGFTYMKRIRSKYDISYLSYLYNDISLGYAAVHTLYTDLGTKNEKVIEFEQKSIDDSSKLLSIDGHVIACTSEKNDLSEYGYKAKKYGTPQVNWLTAYDVESKRTLSSVITSGSEPDKISIRSLFSRHTFKDTEFLVDRGFNTEADKALMSSNGNTYIVPMISSSKDYSVILESLKFDRRRYFVYQKNKYSSIIYYQEFEVEGKRCIAYKDATRELSEYNDYLSKISSKKKGYTEEGLEEYKPFFGLFLLETNISITKANAEVIFCHYKKRWSIETFYNYIRNKCDFNALYQQDYFMSQGLSFIVTVSGMIFNDVFEYLSKYNYSVEDVIDTIGKLKMTFEDQKWLIKNRIKEVRDLCLELNFEIPDSLE